MISGNRKFDLSELALKASAGVSSVRFDRRDMIFLQGDQADCFYYLLSGKVRLSVVSENGKEAIIAILGPDEIFGESCLLGHNVRRTTACALEGVRAIRVQKGAATKLMADDVGFDEFLIRHLIKTGVRTQEQLLDQLFNSSEKRLARALVMLANYAKENAQDITIPKISQEALAEMVGTTRPRINQFMNKFRKLGYIDYDGLTITVRHSLLSVLLYDSDQDTEVSSRMLSAFGSDH
jgi:CRP/FNR family transcriptional regulator, cyclic AMP receptor protein